MVSESEFFKFATHEIASSLDIVQAMMRLKNYLKDFMPVSGMALIRYDPRLNVGQMLVSICPPGIPVPPQEISIPKNLWSFFGRDLTQNFSVNVVNYVEEPESEQTNRQNVKRKYRTIADSLYPEWFSHLGMSLHLGKDEFGIFSLFSEQPKAYSTFHSQLIAMLRDPITLATANYLQHREIIRLKDMLVQENNFLHQLLNEQDESNNIIGVGGGLKNEMQLVRQVAPLNCPVLLTGETGVGKEVLATAIHRLSERKSGPFVKVNCGALPESIIDSELFGHEKGAFTGASKTRKGRFERADGGTLFLDEVGELPPQVQVRLLRVLQENEIERVGGSRVLPVDVRIISATNRNLDEMIRTGKFRKDLWFRLNVVTIPIPPLRERLIDIPALIKHFLDIKSKAFKLPEPPLLPPHTLEKLLAHPWPGNVRELDNVLERALIVHQIKGSVQPLEIELTAELDTPRSLEKPILKNELVRLDDAIAHHIGLILETTGGRIEGPKGAARLLGVKPSTLRSRMKRMGIPYGKTKGKQDATGLG